MLIELRPDTTRADVALLARTTAAHEDVEVRPVRLHGRLFLAVSGDERLVAVPRSPAVLASWSTAERGYRLVARDCGLVRPSVRIGSSTVGGGGFWIAAGPCALESYADTLATCRTLAAQGADALRMGLFKPRSSPYHFPGKGRAGLRLLAEIKAQVGLPVVTEVLDPRDVEAAAEVADCLQVDARNMTNRALLAELGRADRPVLVMRGLRATVAEWLRAAEFVVAHGNAEVVLCARGVAGFDDSLAFQPDYGAILAVRQLTELPVIFDPSHSTGRLAAVAPAALSAAAFGADGLLVESHCAPERMHAPGDAAQMYPPGQVAELIEACLLVRRISRRVFAQPGPEPAAAPPGPGPLFVRLPVDRSTREPHLAGRWTVPVPVSPALADLGETFWTAAFLHFLRGLGVRGTVPLLDSQPRRCGSGLVALCRLPIPAREPESSNWRSMSQVLTGTAQELPVTRLSQAVEEREDGCVLLRLPAAHAAPVAAEADLTLAVDSDRVTLLASADLWLRESAHRMAAALADAGMRLAASGAAAMDPAACRAAVAPVAASSFLELFASQVSLHPQTTAAEQDGARLSYAELDSRSERIARALLARGLAREAVVGLALPPGPDLIAAMLGAMKAGVAFLPLDLRSPPARVAEILRDSRTALVLTPDAGVAQIGRGGAQLQAVTAEALLAEGEAAPVALPCLHPASVACIFYTSGSTGGPKGVMFTHGETAAFTEAMAGAFRLSASDRVLQLAPTGFDVLLEEVLPVLAAGGAVILPRAPILESGADLARAVEELRVTGFELTAPYWQEWVSTLVREGREVPDCVRFVAMGGERVQASRMADWRVFGVPLVHVYGLTEATVTTTCFRDEPGAPDPPPTPPLGLSLPGIRVQVLDPGLEPVPAGQVGELFVEGGLARGYLGRPGATAARFVPSPGGRPGSRAYRTGDLVRLEADAGLRYLGRCDHQVKVNGFRIELAEVQAAIADHPAVDQCLAIVREDRLGDKRLVAYLVPAPSAQPPDVTHLRRFAAERLPGYMVPSAFVLLGALPLTSTGKFDRRALPPPPLPTPSPAPAPAAGQVPAQPGSELEQRIAALTGEVLGLDRVAVDEDFFDLGGHSLLALRLLARMRAELGVDLSLRSLFQAPTPAGLARAARLRARSDGDFGVIFPLRATGSRTPLVVVHPMSGLAWCYSTLVRELDAEIPVYGVQARSVGTPGALPQSVDDMLDDYVAEVRIRQPDGPYRLLGWSFGGVVAQALAARLSADGEEVSALILLDAYPAWTWDDMAVPGAGTADPDVLGAVLADFGVDVQDALRAGATAPELLAVAREHFGEDTVLGEELLSTLARTAAHHVRMLRRAEPEPFDGPVLFFTAEHGALEGVGARPLWGRTLTGPVDEYRLPCTHEELLGREMTPSIASILEGRL